MGLVHPRVRSRAGAHPFTALHSSPSCPWIGRQEESGRGGGRGKPENKRAQRGDGGGAGRLVLPSPPYFLPCSVPLLLLQPKEQMEKVLEPPQVRGQQHLARSPRRSLAWESRQERSLALTGHPLSGPAKLAFCTATCQESRGRGLCAAAKESLWNQRGPLDFAAALQAEAQFSRSSQAERAGGPVWCFEGAGEKGQAFASARLLLPSPA